MAGDGILCICIGWRWNWNAMVPIGGVDDDNASTDKGAKRERATKGAKHSYKGYYAKEGENILGEAQLHSSAVCYHCCWPSMAENG